MITNQPQIYEANSHSRVIFKNYNDNSTRDFLNSYRYEPSKNKQYKKWKPDISPEERFKKKRDREEEYLQNFHPDDRPVLLVQKKHEYKGVENPNVFVDPTQREAYYKVSENTETLDDISDEIKQLERFIKRNTLVHKPRVESEQENLSSVYKVEGKEFLPEGFIELDPLLMRDEYEFDGDVDKKNFDEEQRRLKMLRRKQYEQRNQNKIRDVTIFVMDEQKNKALMFLDKWVRQHKRKMHEAELEYVANHLKVPSQKLATLQDLYFKKQEIIKNRKFHDLSQQGTSPAHLRDLPHNIKGQFQRDKFQNVDSRYMNINDSYTPTFLNKYSKKPIQKQTLNTQQQNNTNNNDSRLLDTKELDKTLIKTLNEKNSRLHDSYEDLNVQQSQDQKLLYAVQENKNFIPDYENMIALNQSQESFDQQNGNFDQLQDPFERILNNQNNLKTEEIQQEKQMENFQRKRPSFENDLQRYFDNEIDTLLGKINNHQQKKKSEKILPKKQSIKKEKEQTLKQQPKQYPQDFQKIQILRLPKRLTVFNHQTNGVLEVIHKLTPIAIGNEYFYQTVKQTTDGNNNTTAIITTKNDLGEIISSVEIPPSYIGKNYQNEVNEITPEFRGDQGKQVSVKNDRDQIVDSQILRPKIDQLYDDNLRPQLKNDNFKKSHVIKQENIRTFTLNPVVFNGKQYKQIIEEIEIKEKNTTQINVLTYDENNEILANKRIQPFFRSENYYSIISTQELENGQKRFSLLTKNKKGEDMADYELDIQEKSFKEKYLNNQVEEREGDVQIYNLNPVIVGDRILKQEIHVKEDEQKAKVKTFDDYDRKINQELIDKDKITSKDYSELFDQDSKLVLQTKNNKGEVIANFELPDEYNQIQKSQKFDEIIEVVDHEGQRRASIAVKTSPEQQFRSYQLRPTLIGNQYYQQTINELIDINEPLNNQAVLVTKDEEGNVLDKQELQAEKIAQDYYNQIIDESIDDQGKRRATILTLNNQNEVVGRVEISQSLAEKFGKELCDKIIEECVNENEEKEEDFDLLKIDQNEDLQIEVQQIHLNKDQINQLEEISNEEYFEKLLDLFGDRKGRRSFQKSDRNLSLLRPKSHTYALIPFNYTEKPKLTETNKNLIDQFMDEVNEVHQNYNSQQKPIQNTEDFIQKNKIVQEEIQEKPKRKSTIKKEEVPQRKQTNKSELKVKRKSTQKIDKQPNKQQTVQEAQKQAQERVRSRTKTSKKKNTMTFEDMEKKLQEFENKKETSPLIRDKQPSIVEREFKPSVISKLCENIQQNDNNIENQPQEKSEQSVEKQSLENNEQIQEKEQREDEIEQDQSLREDEIEQDQSLREDDKLSQQQDSEEKNQQEFEENSQNEDHLKEDSQEQNNKENQLKDLQEKQHQEEKIVENEEHNLSFKDEKQDSDIIEQNEDEQKSDQENIKEKIRETLEEQDKKLEEKDEQSEKKIESKKEIKQKLSQKKIRSKRNSIDPSLGAKDKKESSLQKRKSSLKKKTEKKVKSKKSPQKKKSIQKNEKPKGKHTSLLEDKDKLKSYFDEYIQNNQINDEDIRKKLSDIMEEPERRDSNILKKLQKKKGQTKDQVLDEFVQFCKELEKDSKYKRSVFFATLFYYFTDLKTRKKFINKQLM